MNKSKFEKMSLEELRAYVLSHRQDNDAFHVYCDRRRRVKSQKDPRPKTSWMSGYAPLPEIRVIPLTTDKELVYAPEAWNMPKRRA